MNVELQKLVSRQGLTVIRSFEEGAERRRIVTTVASSHSGFFGTSIFSGGAGTFHWVNFAPESKEAQWLEEALRDLDEIDEEAREEGFATPNNEAKAAAKLILERLAYVVSAGPVIYPTADEEVAILFSNREKKSAVVILCDGSGGGACFSTTSGKNRRARYADAREMPGAFEREQLRNLFAE